MYNDFPVKDKKRAERRFKNRKAEQHAIDVAKSKTHRMSEDFVDPYIEHTRRNADNLKGCSCAICSPIRKFDGPTIQELRHIPTKKEVHDSIQGTE
jgi:hypothetical protein